MKKYLKPFGIMLCFTLLALSCSKEENINIQLNPIHQLGEVERFNHSVIEIKDDTLSRRICPISEWRDECDAYNAAVAEYDRNPTDHNFYLANHYYIVYLIALSHCEESEGAVCGLRSDLAYNVYVSQYNRDQNTHPECDFAQLIYDMYVQLNTVCPCT